jgi:hypothetical protein
MDMLAYFLGRLAGGGPGGSNGEGIVYTSAIYEKEEGEDNVITFTDDAGIDHKMECFYEDGKIKTVIFDGEEIEMEYDLNNIDNLKFIGNMEVDMSKAPTSGNGGSGADVSFDSNSGIVNFDNVLVNQGVINL